MKPTYRAVLGLLALLGSAACSDTVTTGGGPGPVPADSLTFLRLAPTAPPLCADSIGFWAFRGTSVERKLEFPDSGAPLDCSGSTKEFLVLKLEDLSLKFYPDGTPFQLGDSVFIAVKWVGSDSILFHLEPSGLVFDPAKPAGLTIKYDEAGPDLNEDGQVDNEDDQVEQVLDIWRQPTLADPYTKVGTAKFEDQDEIEADLNGFSRYAIAY